MSIIVTDKESREIRNLYLIEQNTKFKGKKFDKKMKKENKQNIFNAIESVGVGDIFNLKIFLMGT